jgi:hypothetical protein
VPTSGTFVVPGVGSGALKPWRASIDIDIREHAFNVFQAIVKRINIIELFKYI